MSSPDDNESGAADPSAAPIPLPPGVLSLGLVSLLTDISSEMIFSVFAVFFTTVAGASSAMLGLVEGLADFSAAALNQLAGWLSDRSGRRKLFALAGYGFSTLAKVILVFASSMTGLAIFRVVERLGKGLRGPPRDAWLSDLAPPPIRGYAFGVHKALDKAGAVLGPLLAYLLLRVLGESPAAFRTLFWVALIPAMLAVAVLACVHEQPGMPRRHEGLGQGWSRVSRDFKRFLLPAGCFALAYFSLGFVLLRAHQLGFSPAQIVLLYALFNVSCVLAAPWVGKWGDRIGRRPIVALGYSLYALFNLAAIWATQTWAMCGLFLVYGLFYAIDESQSKAYVADLEPERQATALGIYGFVTGALYVPASLIAGLLWTVSPTATFVAAAVVALLATVLLGLLRKRA